MLLLADATDALAVLDVERLDGVAARLRALLGAPMAVRSTPEIVARQRVFAGVMRATGENLAVLRRVAGEVETWGR